MADAIYQGVHEAVIIDGRVPHSILLELFSTAAPVPFLPPQPPGISIAENRRWTYNKEKERTLSVIAPQCQLSRRASFVQMWKLFLQRLSSPFGGAGALSAERVFRLLHPTGGTSMDSEKVIKRDNAYVLHTYNRNPVVLERATACMPRAPRARRSGLHQRHRRQQPGRPRTWPGPRPGCR